MGKGNKGSSLRCERNVSRERSQWHQAQTLESLAERRLDILTFDIGSKDWKQWRLSFSRHRKRRASYWPVEIVGKAVVVARW